LPSYQDHINQSVNNLSFFEQVNRYIPTQYDWQVTISFYSSLHLINAHLAHFGLQYRKHKDVKDALNPYSLSPAKLPENEYSAYISLQSLSRRARYLVNEKNENLSSTNPFFTYEKHLSRALKHLNTLMTFFDAKYTLDLTPIKIICSDLKYADVKFIVKP
jgi:hypothetical protein